jgi:hypothetical protein
MGKALIKVVLEGIKDPVFATTATVPMEKILAKYAFTKSGKAWSGQAGRLSVWKRKEVADSVVH